MDANLKNTLLTVCDLLEKHEVQYIIVGGAAVALNGYYRHSMNVDGTLSSKPDIDVWYNPTYTNYFNLLKVIEDLGQDVTAFRNEQAPNPSKSFFKLDFTDFSFDLLPSVKAEISFFESSQRKETVEVNNTKIHFMCYQDLITDKLAGARKKDLEDIEQLKKIRGEDGKF